MKWLYPENYVRTVFDIDYEGLRGKGYKAIFFDIDNTLAAFDELVPSQDIIDLINKLKKLGFKICLMSNNNATRVNNFNHALGVHAFANAGKPFVGTLKKAQRLVKVSNTEVVFAGDQLFTDVWAGNLLRMHTVLVKPIQEKEQFITKIKRGVEGLILNGYLKKKGIHRFK